jgi:hypothetical protein
MQIRNRALSCVLVAAVAFVGACADTPTTGPQAMEGDAAAFARITQSALGMDAAFARVSQENPGFGGAFVDESGTLNIYMKGDAVSPMSTRLASSLEMVGVQAQGRQVRVLEGRYDFMELSAVRNQMNRVLGQEGVVFTDVDEARNRVTIGVSDRAAAALVRRTAAALGEDGAAVHVEMVEPIVFMATLRDLVRPVVGGLQINFPGFLCTLGFNIRSRSPIVSNDRGYVTNSHCTSTQGGVENTPHGQPLLAQRIGQEIYDPQYWTGAPCPAGRRCRYSDSSVGRYDENVPSAFARIARTTGFNSLVIDTNNPHFHIVGQQSAGVVGDSIHKVGRTTGWTRGVITQSCATVNVGGETITLFCQNIVTGPTNSVSGGDSGSGTWSFDRRQGAGPNDVILRGLLWGGGGTTVFVYSPLDQIAQDGTPAGLSWRAF